MMCQFYLFIYNHYGTISIIISAVATIHSIRHFSGVLFFLILLFINPRRHTRIFVVVVVVVVLYI